MKKIIIITLILFFIPILPCLADDWDNVYKNDVDIRQPVPVVTDKEFQEAYDSKVRKKKKKDKYENVKGDDMKGLSDIEANYPSVMLYEKFYTDDNRILQEGFYKVVVVLPKPQDPEQKYFVHFFQGHSHKGKIQMYETDDDYVGVLDDYSDIMYLFRYVGILSCKDRIIYVYPKYIDTTSSSIPKKEMLQVINVLRKYNKSRKEIIREYTGKEGKNNVNILSLMLFLIRDYLSNGIY